MKGDKLIDQTALAESVSEKIPYEFKSKFLVKPLEIKKVMKKVTTNINAEAESTDKNGVTAKDIIDVKEEIKEVDSGFREGIVLKVPHEYARSMQDEKFPSMPINVGDIVVIREHVGTYFDLVKDTMFVDPYNVICVKKND